MAERLSKAQFDFLALLAKGSRDGITHRGTARVLERRGLVMCRARPGQLISNHVWRITADGRALLEQLEQDRAANA